MFVQLLKCLKVLKVLTTLFFIIYSLSFYVFFFPIFTLYSNLLYSSQVIKNKQTKNSSFINNIPTGEHVVILCIVAAT